MPGTDGAVWTVREGESLLECVSLRAVVVLNDGDQWGKQYAGAGVSVSAGVAVAMVGAGGDFRCVGVCCGAPVAGFVLWTAVEASHAAASPEEAAERVVSAMLPGVDEGIVWKYLCDDHREKLQGQVATVRARLAEKFDIHYRLEAAYPVKAETADGTQVRLTVALVWSPPPEQDQAPVFHQGEGVPWTFETVNDQRLLANKGWKVCSFQTAGM
jgi:hypothetical protein